MIYGFNRAKEDSLRNGQWGKVVSFVLKFTLIKNESRYHDLNEYLISVSNCRLHEGERRLFEHSWNDAQE